MNDNESHVDLDTINRYWVEINFNPPIWNYKQYDHISLEKWMFSAILFHANQYFENKVEDFTFGSYILELSLHAFVGMKYDRANF